MAKGGGGSNQPVKQEVTQSNLPEYARPYFEGMMQRASTALSTPYTPYGQERIAGFTPQQQQLQQNILGQQTPGEFGTAANLASAAGLGSLQAGQYATGQFGSQQIGMPNLQQYSMGAPQDVYSRNVGAGNMQSAQSGFQPNLNYFQMGGARDVASRNVRAQDMQGAQTGYQPNLQQYEMGGARDVGAQGVNAFNMEAAQSGYRPDLEAFQMGAAERVGGADVNAPTMQAAQTNYGQGPLEQFRMEGPQAFGLEQAQKYMSPFAEAVTEPQKREAVTSARRSQVAQDLGSVRQGTYGGSRQLLASMERERNLGQQLGDIDVKGRQAAYENAQSQFERDRAAGMTAGRENLQAALGQQQLGVSTGLQASLANLSNEQQANVNNQAMQFQARGMSADNAMKAALANQQAGLTTGQQNLSARLGVQELGAQQNLQTAMQNLSNEQQSRVNNQAQQFQAQGMNADNALKAALANQGVDVTRGTQNLQSQLQTQQIGAQTGTQLALANLSNEQQSRVNNQAQRFQAQGMNADNALKAALANQGVDVTRATQNLQANLQTQQTGAEIDSRTALANLSNEQQSRVNNQALQFQAQCMNADNALKAALANQQAGLTTGTQNLNAALQTQQLGTQSGLQALQANQQADLERQRMQEQSRQFGGNLGLQGYGQAGQMAQTLSNIGTGRSQSDLARFGQQTSTAAQQQALQQQYMDMAYQDFLRQQGYPAEQLQQYSSLLRGVPVQPNSTTATYAQQPGIGQQLLGTGLGAASIYKTFGGA